MSAGKRSLRNSSRSSITHFLRRYRLRNDQKIKRIMEYLNFVKWFKWVRPSESKGDPDCAIMEFDVELKPEIVKWVSLVIAVLRLWDPHIDTDHPVFAYLGKQRNAHQISRLTFTVSIRAKK